MEHVYTLVDDAANKAAPDAVQSTILVRKLAGKHGNGYYFSATDKAPKPDEYEFLTQ